MFFEVGKPVERFILLGDILGLSREADCAININMNTLDSMLMLAGADKLSTQSLREGPTKGELEHRTCTCETQFISGWEAIGESVTQWGRYRSVQPPYLQGYHVGATHAHS